ncbi:hypothetical protein CEUSTIGMA_g9753.t1 [Chlamydomonas eustigma]|uniref:RING-type domain-containing protein n=1 Tax=Chlamydomonas eustigma TaxID=1157962 RepID=A0A250XGX1_9CHLO|nr:hypothetical protein CEUSTIGMA_g9753.t1 [Chlamydomonas eustigma]|eukprot:GAX82324.1 hypothetical protein CEUSTIGMA_g9753.t1 [Chlamydomonas eustigma]
MTSSAHTASVWGNGNLALVAAKERKLIEGDEECVICRNDDIPATVALQPCRHVVCIACVELMRANNVFKADKGIKCPFCRGYVEAYEALGSANEAIRKVIDTANKAAALSKGARGFENSRSKPQDGTGGGVDRESWVCTSCNKTNVWWRLGCGTVDCQGSDPVRKQKVPVANFAEIEMNLKERYHLKLNKHFSEIGLIFESGKTAGDIDEVHCQGLLCDIDEVHCQGLLCDIDEVHCQGLLCDIDEVHCQGLLCDIDEVHCQGLLCDIDEVHCQRLLCDIDEVHCQGLLCDIDEVHCQGLLCDIDEVHCQGLL